MREQEQFDQIFRTYYEPLLMSAMRYLDDMDDANDVVSAVFEDLWKNRATIDPATVKSYLYIGVRNLCIDMLRRQKCHRRYVEFAQLTSADSAEDVREIDASYRDKVVNRLFEQLKPPTSDILRACYVDGKKYKQVAEEMSISISTVKKHIIKALKFIREMRKNSLRA